MKELWPLKSLSQLMYKTVRITCKDGRIVEGKTFTFCDEFELEEQEEFIGIRLYDETTDGVFFNEIASVVEL